MGRPSIVDGLPPAAMGRRLTAPPLRSQTVEALARVSLVRVEDLAGRTATDLAEITGVGEAGAEDVLYLLARLRSEAYATDTNRAVQAVQPSATEDMLFEPALADRLRDSLWRDREVTEGMVDPRIYHRLSWLGVKTLGQLAQVREPLFLRMTGVSIATLDAMRRALEAMVVNGEWLPAPEPAPSPVAPAPPPVALVQGPSPRQRQPEAEAEPPPVDQRGEAEAAVRALRERHGPDCNCAAALAAKSLGIEAAVVAAVRPYLPSSTRVSVALLARHAEKIPAFHFADVVARIAALRTQKCIAATTSDVDVPDVPWREIRRVGVFAKDDRWPDEIDAAEWAAMADVQPIEPAVVAMSDFAHARAASRYASQSWDWNTTDATEEPLDLSRWGRDDATRALWLLRSTQGYPWAARVAEIGHVAACAGQPFREASRYIRYVDECDRGLCVPDPIVESVLRTFRPVELERLGARVRMQDHFIAAPAGERYDDPDAVHDLSDGGITDIEVPTGEDGQPDPLAELRNLLPGGKWVLGKATIVHTRTELDDELLPRLRDGAPTLVILSGNAGDGKTAFIESVLETAGAKEPDVPGRPKPAIPNELEINLNGRRYLVVLDGSEDTYSKSNSALLHDALEAFRGDAVVKPERGTLIAVNKGRLLSFLEAEHADYQALWRLVQQRYVVGELTSDSDYLLIDLNDRTVVGLDSDSSLFGGVLQKLLDWDGWKDCPSCDAFATCPVMFNVQALRLPYVRSRLWELFALIDLDDRLHVTARHVVTRLATVLTGGLRCPDIRRAAAEGAGYPQRSYFYASAFLGRLDESSVEEAALNEIAAAYDPAETADPQRDGVIGTAIAAGTIAEAVRVLDEEPTSDLGALEAEAVALAGRSIDASASASDQALEYRQAHLVLMSKLLRRRYFLGGADDVTPVRSFTEYRTVSLVGEPDLLAGRILRSLNHTLGIDRADGDLIVPRDYARGLAGTGLAVRVPASQFAVGPGTGVGTAFQPSRFTRSWPRSVLLEAWDGPLCVATLSIPLLMLEILDRAERGFRPTSRTERNYMIRVATFYRRLAEHQWRQPLDYVLYEHGRIRAGVSLAGRDLLFWVP